MSTKSSRHTYDLVFNQRACNLKVSFEAYDRALVFADHNRIGGCFEIFEDGQRITSATYSPLGGFWVIGGPVGRAKS